MKIASVIFFKMFLLQIVIASPEHMENCPNCREFMNLFFTRLSKLDFEIRRKKKKIVVWGGPTEALVTGASHLVKLALLVGPQAWLDGPEGGTEEQTYRQKISLFYRTLFPIGAATQFLLKKPSFQYESRAGQGNR